MTRLEKIDHICRSFPTWPEWVQKAALHAIGTHIGPTPATTRGAKTGRVKLEIPK